MLTKNTSIASSPHEMREFFNNNNTRPYGFRIHQLRELKKVIIKYEKIILAALYTDLKKSAEESYATEIGLVITEINVATKKLKKWMRPVNASTNLVNFPSSSKIYHDPLGVVLIIAPWNYPFQLLLIPLIGAIAGGNCAFLKPSELAPATAAVIEKIIVEIYPTEFVRLLQGDGATIIPDLINRFRFDYIFYTGSIEIGRSIYRLAAEQLIPVTLELGGKSPAIVCKDANIAVAARRIDLGNL